MPFKLRRTSETGFDPPAVAMLASTSGIPTHHAGLSLRPPLAAYHVSLQHVYAAFPPVINRAAELAAAIPTDRDHGVEGDLMRAQRDLVYALFEHLDDCERIIESFYPAGEEKLRGKATARFRKGFKAYRRHLGAIVNGIKHRQMRLRSVVVYDGKTSLPGYFVEGVRVDGSIGPSPVIHPERDEAFSFGYDLRLHLVHLYLVADELSAAVQQATGLPPAPDPSRMGSKPTMLEIAKGVIAASALVFPNEVRKPYPLVSLRGEAGSEVLELEHPSRAVRSATLRRIRVRCQFIADGVTSTYKVPIF